MLAGVAGESGGRLAEVAEDVRDVVRALDEVVWALEPRNDTLSSFVDYLYDYAESYTESAGLRLRADIPIELQDLPMSSKVRHAVYLCVKEALNNVVKHSGARTAFVAISVSRVDVRVSVGDDGEGFANPRRGGNGIANMHERMERIGGEFEIGQRTGGGCEVVFLFNLAWGMT
jgi:signal transduction histidine kinase